MRPTQRFLIGGAGGADRLADAGLAILRLFAGLALAFGHGLRKVVRRDEATDALDWGPAEGFIGRIGGFGFPMPEVFAWLVALAEFGGGLLLAIGLLTRPVSAFVLLSFTGVVVFAHMIPGDTFRGMELALMFWFLALFYLLAGGGRYSADGFIRSRTEAHTVSRYVR